MHIALKFLEKKLIFRNLWFSCNIQCPIVFQKNGSDVNALCFYSQFLLNKMPELVPISSLWFRKPYCHNVMHQCDRLLKVDRASESKKSLPPFWHPLEKISCVVR